MVKKKKLLITGVAGFIGTNFTEKALKVGHKVTGIDCLNYSGIKNNINRFKYNKNFNFKEVDINNKKKLGKIIEKFKPNYIINFAAESHVDRSIENPISFVESNCLGVINILQCIKDLKLQKKIKLLHISTDEVYGQVNLPSKENNKYFPNSPYSASKAAADLFIRAWNKTFNVKNLILHPSNNYGPRQFPEKLIPLMIINGIHKKKMPIYGDGKHIREWIFVEDTVDAILMCLQKDNLEGHLNLGSGERYSNIDIVKKICVILENIYNNNSFNYCNLISFTKDRPGHDKGYAVNSDLARKQLNWSAKVGLEEGLLKTVKWYTSNTKWWKQITKKIYDGKRLGLIK